MRHQQLLSLEDSVIHGFIRSVKEHGMFRLVCACLEEKEREWTDICKEMKIKSRKFKEQRPEIPEPFGTIGDMVNYLVVTIIGTPKRYNDQLLYAVGATAYEYSVFLHTGQVEKQPSKPCTNMAELPMSPMMKPCKSCNF